MLSMQLLLARLQFAFTVSFHFIFPSFTIGLASYLAVLEALWLRTGRPVYLDLFKYWLKIFALVFGMGVVSGIVLSYQFGTNWSVFSDRAGPVIGPLMAYEVLTAFFLEAGFLGVMLFGLNRVGHGSALHRHRRGRGRHLHLGLLDSLGQQLDADAGRPFGQSRTGSSCRSNWLTIIFNPSFPYRLVHTVLAAYLTTALVVGAVGAWHLLRDRANQGARVMFSMAMGHDHRRRADPDLRRRPARAEYAGAPAGQGDGDGGSFREPRRTARRWSCSAGPTRRRRRCDYAISIPKASSLILKHDLDAPLAGLDTVTAKRMAAGRHRLLVFPHHGRAGLPDAWPGRLEPARPVAPSPLRLALAASPSQ